MKPETLRLKSLLADLGIPRTESRATCGQFGVIATLSTDHGRRTVVEHADRLVAEGFAVLLHTYRCGCPAMVTLCASSSATLRRTVRNWTHDCPVGGELLPVTPVDWLTSEQEGDGDVR